MTKKDVVPSGEVSTKLFLDVEEAVMRLASAMEEVKDARLMLKQALKALASSPGLGRVDPNR